MSVSAREPGASGNGCGPPVPSEPEETKSVAAELRGSLHSLKGRETSYTRPMGTIVRGACPLDCPDTCSWLVEVEDGRAVSLRGDRAHPFTHGALCPKVNRYLDALHGPGRVTHPLRRVGPKGEGRFERISWDEAL